MVRSVMVFIKKSYVSVGGSVSSEDAHIMTGRAFSSPPPAAHSDDEAFTAADSRSQDCGE